MDIHSIPALDLLLRGVLLGVAASALMDLWGLVLRRGFQIATLDYSLLGRWIGHMRRGRFAHDRIGDARPVRGERALGWVAHYSIGIAFALLLLGIWGLDWARSPTLWPPLLIGLGTTAAPWFVMQPAMGVGFAASKSANPRTTRLRNLATHSVYGVGLYLAAMALA